MNNLPAFASSVEEAQEVLSQLNDLLFQEREALKQRDASGVHQLLAKKTSLLEKLEHNGMERNQALHNAGFEANDQGARDYLQQQAPEKMPELGVQWEGLKTALENCQEANTVNGRIIHRSRQQINLLLDIMRGQPDNPRLYTQTGSSAMAQRRLPLAEA